MVANPRDTMRWEFPIGREPSENEWKRLTEPVNVRVRTPCAFLKDTKTKSVPRKSSKKTATKRKEKKKDKGERHLRKLLREQLLLDYLRRGVRAGER